MFVGNPVAKLVHSLRCTGHLGGVGNNVMYLVTVKEVPIEKIDASIWPLINFKKFNNSKERK